VAHAEDVGEAERSEGLVCLPPISADLGEEDAVLTSQFASIYFDIWTLKDQFQR